MKGKGTGPDGSLATRQVRAFPTDLSLSMAVKMIRSNRQT